MSKRGWAHGEFMKYLDELSRAAGVPDSRRGTPNTTILEDLTGVRPTQIGRWRAGSHQPTTDSLRMIANGLAPRAGRDPAQVLVTLEVKAGRRSEAEARAATGEPTPEAVESVEAIIRRARALATSPHLTDEERAPYVAMVEMYERDLQRMKDDLDDLMKRYEQRRRA
ncbi:hypothetical protein [Glycomyces halotolerans]